MLKVFRCSQWVTKKKQSLQESCKPKPKTEGKYQTNVLYLHHAYSYGKNHSSAFKSFQHLWTLYFWRDEHITSSSECATFLKASNVIYLQFSWTTLTLTNQFSLK